MPMWLVIIILALCFLVISVALVGAIVIKASVLIHKANVERDSALELVDYKQQLLNAYGIKEINIGEEK